MKSLNIIFFVFIISAARVSSQNDFSKVFSSASGPSISSDLLVNTADDGCIVAGAYSSATGFLLRLDSSGNIVWNKTNNRLQINDIARGLDTTYYIAAMAGTTSDSSLIIKLNAHGGITWAKKLQFSNYTLIKSLSLYPTNDSGVVICGYLTAQPDKSFICKFDKNGSINWSNIISVGGLKTSYRSVKQTPDSGYVMCGSLNNQRASIIKLSKNGSVAWCNSYLASSTSSLLGADVVIQRAGFLAYFFLGDSKVLARIDSIGTVIGAKESSDNYSFFNPNSPGSRIRKAADRGFYITGYYASGFLRIDSMGNIIYETILQARTATDILLLKNKKYLMTGVGPFIGAKSGYFLEPQINVMKADSNGNGTCTNTRNVNSETISLANSPENYTVTSSGSAFSINLTLTDSPLVTRDGCVDYIGGFEDYTNDHTISVFPNPSRGKFTVSSKNMLPGTVSYSLLNTNAEILKEGTMTFHDNVFETDFSGLNPDVYILKIFSVEKIIAIKKLVVTP